MIRGSRFVKFLRNYIWIFCGALIAISSARLIDRENVSTRLASLISYELELHILPQERYTLSSTNTTIILNYSDQTAHIELNKDYHKSQPFRSFSSVVTDKRCMNCFVG